MKNLKVSSLFHWLYGAVMFLPILLLPVFMIYSHRHTIDSGTLEVSQSKVVDFNQLQQQPTSINDFYTNDALLTFDYENSSFVAMLSGGNIVTYPIRLTNLNPNHIYFGSVNIKASSTSVQLYEFYQQYPVTTINVFERVSFTFQNKMDLSFTIRDLGTTFDPVYFNSFMCIDLTQMFGEGNEPTQQQFNDWYTDDYYEYTLSRKELLKDYSTITYSDTDIMSQATYQLYNATDKYFNISQFFGFENLWDYMLLNWFGGNVTIYLRIFWQLLTYWLVVSIAWLIFDLFMYVPKLAHRWLDRSAIE